MKKLYKYYNKIILCFCIVIFACNKKENDIEKMKTNLINDYNDLAFKNSWKVNIYTIEVIKIDTLNKGLIDSNYIYSESNNKNEIYLNKSKEAQSKAEGLSPIIELSRLANNSNSLQKYKEEFLTYIKEASLYIDSIKQTKKISDSLLILVSKNKNFEKIYQMKAFTKATFYSKNDSTNLLDTVYYNFTKDLKLYPPDKSEYKIKF